MQPLLFLLKCQIKNGIKRAFTSPRRMLGLVFFFGYYLSVFRPFATRGMPMPERALVDMPPVSVLNACAFGLLSMAALLYCMSLTTYRSTHRPADVDVLFPTPISPKLILGLRLLREALMNLMLPLVFLLFGFKPANMVWASVVRDLDPSAAAATLRFGGIAYFLMAATLSTLAFAGGLYFHRQTVESDRARKIANWGILLWITVIVGGVSLAIRANPTLEGALGVLNSSWLRGVFFLPGFAADFALMPLTHDTVGGLAGIGFLLAMLAMALYLAFSQHTWLYEIAAQRASATVQTARFRRSGDMVSVAAEYARTKGARSQKVGWIQRQKWVGPSALIWKDLLVQRRSVSSIALVFPLLGVLLSGLFAFTDDTPSKNIGWLLSFVLGMMIFACGTVTGQSGFIEMLQRLDSLKPLPFSARTTIAYEVISKSLLAVVTAIVSFLAAIVMLPSQISILGPSMILGIFGSIVISSVYVLTTLIFPEVDDPTQRGLRGVVQLLAIGICCVPSASVYLALCFGAKWPPILAVIVPCGMYVGIAYILWAQAGKMFADFSLND
ncbi:MAG: hypothetical protein J0L72_07720 [Armatimonadetes bacterium]|nr:hypothetical protein [Armatimonadota bacterium]